MRPVDGTTKNEDVASPPAANDTPVADVPGETLPVSKSAQAWADIIAATSRARFDRSLFKQGLQKLASSLIEDHAAITDKYNVLVLYDDSTLVRADADRIYEALTGFSEQKPILLILYSAGGSIEAGYLISKLCHEHSKDEFSVAVPRLAKSAATLICCGADVLHMGSLSELGPIDPQIRRLPALGLKYAVQHIAELTEKYPGASVMFADYLSKSLDLVALGYYERVVESAEQYAERLLTQRRVKLPPVPPKKIAHTLTTEYKDHGFVIDDQETEKVFGTGFVKRNQPEYVFASSLYSALTQARRLAAMSGWTFYLIGTLESEAVLMRKPDEDDDE